MLVRKKSDEQVQNDVSNVKSDINLGIIKSELYGNLSNTNYSKYFKHSKVLQKQREKAEKNNALIIRICENKKHINGLDSGRKTTINNVIVEFGKYKKTLSDHDGLLSNDLLKGLNLYQISSLSIQLQHDNGSSEIEIPNNDQKNILKYLIEETPPVTFDCQSFIHYAKGVKITDHHASSSNIADKWIISQVNQNELTAGDCVCTFSYFSNNNKTFNDVKHFAYYIGSGLFLSKLGVSGSLGICTLQEIHNFYGTKEFVRMVPNPDYEENKNIIIG